jgi:hypothetical protein
VQQLQTELRRLIGDPGGAPVHLRHPGEALPPVPFWGLFAFGLPLCFRGAGPVPALDRHRASPARRAAVRPRGLTAPGSRFLVSQRTPG